MTVPDALQQEILFLHAQICQGLADSKRILLLYALAEGPRRVTDLAETLGLPQPTVSHHLKILRERGLVTAAQEGTAVYYALADERVIQALDLLRDVLRAQLALRSGLVEQMSAVGR
ncbi:MAG: ArsR family transcriptional regulator [Thermoflexia bacterium]|nr:MAG: ArsR family transcriptional regulator [Thermoflexia bacterium]